MNKVFTEEVAGLGKMIGKEVVVESFYHKEISGILISVSEIGVNVDYEVFIPMRSVFRIYLRDRFERDKKREMEEETEREKDKKKPKPIDFSKLPNVI